MNAKDRRMLTERANLFAASAEGPKTNEAFEILVEFCDELCQQALRRFVTCYFGDWDPHNHSINRSWNAGEGSEICKQGEP